MNLICFLRGHRLDPSAGDNGILCAQDFTPGSSGSRSGSNRAPNAEGGLGDMTTTLALAWIAVAVPVLIVLFIVLSVLTDGFRDWEFVISCCIIVALFVSFSWGFSTIRSAQKQPVQTLNQPASTNTTIQAESQ